MFQRDFIGHSDFTNKADRIASYKQFLKDTKLDEVKFPYSLETKETFKGKPIVFTVSGWGGYFNANNEWTLFIAYRSNNPKHTKQHCWSWDSENEEAINYRIMEFIN